MVLDNRMTQVTTLLRQTRDSKQIPLTTMEQATRIPLSYLQVLEGNGPSHLLAEPMYLIPYLRTYAHELGLNPSTVVTQFVAAIEAEPVTQWRPTERVSRERPQPFAHVVSWGVYLVLLVGVFFLASQYFRRDQSQVADQRVITTAQVRDGQAAATPMLAPTILAPAELPQAVEARPLEKAVQTETTERPSSAHLSAATVATIVPKQQRQVLQTRREVTTQRPPASQGPFTLRLTATAREVWVQNAIDGGPVRRMRLQHGQTVTWVAQRRHVVSVDDAGGVQASLNGRALQRLGARGRSRLNIAIP